MVVPNRFEVTFSLLFSSVFLVLTASHSAAQSPGCWFWPPGGVYRSGLNQVAVTPNYAEANDPDGVAWLDDERVAIGFTGYTTGASKSGLIRMYKGISTRFEYQNAIRPPDDAYGLSRFGRQIATSGNWLASTYVLSGISGSVALFEDPSGDGNWTLRAQLRADAAADDDDFGAALAMDGEWLTVIDLGLTGGIYIFKKSQSGIWERNDLLTLPGYENGRAPVSKLVPVMNSGVLAVGQPSGITGFAGKVHIWHLIGGVWQFQNSLAGADSASGDQFGDSVSLTSSRLAVGAPRHDAVAADKGAVYLFKRNGDSWAQETKFTNTTETVNLGRAVSLSPDESYLGLGANNAYFAYKAAGANWEYAGRNGGGNAFYSWESPAGTVRNYVYGTTNATPELPNQRGNQTVVKFRFNVSLLQHGTHEVITRRQTNAQTTCIWIPIGLQGHGRSSGPGIADQDNDGTSDLAEAYFGTYFDTYNTLATGLQATKPEGSTLTIEWARAPQDQSSVQAAAEWSTDLHGSWTANGINVQKIGDEPETGRELMQATVPQTGATAAFFRLNITAP